MKHMVVHEWRSGARTRKAEGEERARGKRREVSVRRSRATVGGGTPLLAVSGSTRQARWALAYALVIAVAWVSACTDEPAGILSEEPASLSVTPATAGSVGIGSRVQLTAEVRVADGRVATNAAVSWTSGNPEVATVSSKGLVTAVGPGTAVITAMVGGVSTTMQFSVADPDYAVLEALYERTGGHGWENNDGWLESHDLGTWHGVDTDGSGRVVRLLLGDNNLQGDIPPDLGDLRRLEVLHLAGNKLGGEIPAELAQLGRLKVLSLNGNLLAGGIPEELGNLSRLEGLGLANNELTGEIPALERMSQLEVVSLMNNELSGAIPPELGGLGNLQELWLSGNLLAGEIPEELGNLDRLRQLRLDDNRLTGAIPRELGELRNLDELWLSHNALSGQIPPLEGLQYLSVLRLSHNELTGTVPVGLGALTSLTQLLMGGNPGLGGSLPLALSGTPLEVLGYANTAVCIPIEDSFLAWLDGIPIHSGTGVYCAHGSDRGILEALYRATHGPNWTRSDNWLTEAPLDDWYGVDTDSSGRVTSLLLEGNGLSGYIPSELGSLGSLRHLDLRNNFVRGEIPPELGNLSTLEYLDLRANGLTGEIPPEVGNLGSLRTLLLTGDSEFNQLGWSNRLTGPIPPELGGLTSLVTLDLSGNDLTGEIPSELGNLGSLRHLLLNFNELTGQVPSEIGNLRSLEVLALHFNDLRGPLPLSLAALDNLEEFLYTSTLVCVPADQSFRAWLNALSLHEGNGARLNGIGCESDRDILATLYHSTNGPQWTNSDNWLTDAALDDWYGVSTDNSGRVTMLYLDSNRLSGSIPPELGRLSSLEELDLTRTYLKNVLAAYIGPQSERSRESSPYDIPTGRAPGGSTGARRRSAPRSSGACTGAAGVRPASSAASGSCGGARSSRRPAGAASRPAGRCRTPCRRSGSRASRRGRGRGSAAPASSRGGWPHAR